MDPPDAWSCKLGSRHIISFARRLLVWIYEITLHGRQRSVGADKQWALPSENRYATLKLQQDPLYIVRRSGGIYDEEANLVIISDGGSRGSDSFHASHEAVPGSRDLSVH
jgi:hypothetical protein